MKEIENRKRKEEKKRKIRNGPRGANLARPEFQPAAQHRRVPESVSYPSIFH
jgi:hypothetical protein